VGAEPGYAFASVHLAGLEAFVAMANLAIAGMSINLALVAKRFQRDEWIYQRTPNKII